MERLACSGVMVLAVHLSGDGEGEGEGEGQRIEVCQLEVGQLELIRRNTKKGKMKELVGILRIGNQQLGDIMISRGIAVSGPAQT